MSALQDIRVLEIAGGVGPTYAAKLLADLGADVIRVEGDRDVVRSRPHDVHRWLNTNKRSVSVAADLVASADLVLHDLTPSAASAAGLAPAALLAAHPRLVIGAVTPYGSTGPWAEYAATEINIIHAASWGNVSPAAATDPSLPPLKAPGHHATLMGATVAATACLAAVDRAARTGVGEYVDFSLFASGARLTETAPAAASFLGADPSRLGVRTLMPWGIFRCRDGLMQFICVEQAQWESLVRLMGEPEWAVMEVFATNDDRRANADLLLLYLSEWMAEQTVADLFRKAQAARICMVPLTTMEQLAADPHFAARGFFVDGPDGLRLPGSGFRLDQPWWGLRRAAPDAGAHDGESWRPRTVAPPEPVAATGVATRPLEGIRVCDFTWVWAGPYCTQLLAHLGADVVRLESPDHLCLFRRMPFNPPELPLTPDTNGLFQLYNSDKRSVGIDLRHADARAVIERLVAHSDVVVENFAVGTLASLGFGIDELRAINPDVIVVSLSGFGQDGPYADYMAYGPCGGAVAGLYAANGYEGGDAAETGVAIGDPGTGLTAAWAAVAAVVGRRRSGIAAVVDVGMVEAIAATVGELWMQYLAEGVSPGPAGNRDPQWAPHGVYHSGDDQWMTIACVDDASWQALARLVDADGAGEARLADDARLAHAAGRKQHEAEIDAALRRWVEGRDRWELTRRLQAVGVAAVPSLSPLPLWQGNEQLDAIGMLERPDHPVTGRHVVPGIPWRLTNGPNGLRRPAPLLGQHNHEVLGEVGFTPAEIAALTASGALRGGAGSAAAGASR